MDQDRGPVSLYQAHVLRQKQAAGIVLPGHRMRLADLGRDRQRYGSREPSAGRELKTVDQQHRLAIELRPHRDLQSLQERLLPLSVSRLYLKAG